MSFNTSVAENVQSKMEELIEMVSGDASRDKTAYEMEGQLWREMLAMGQQLMQLFFAIKEKQEIHQDVHEVDHIAYPYVGQRSRKYVSLFGDVTVRRACYWLKGMASQFPLDDQLSLPERSYSDMVQERISELSTMMTYEEAVSVFSRWLGWDLPKRSSEQITVDHADYVAAYYEAYLPPAAAVHDTILVVSADGKGIPMTRKDSPPPKQDEGVVIRKQLKKKRQ